MTLRLHILYYPFQCLEHLGVMHPSLAYMTLVVPRYRKTRYKNVAVSRPLVSAKQAALVGIEPPTSRPSVRRTTVAPLV